MQAIINNNYNTSHRSGETSFLDLVRLAATFAVEYPYSSSAAVNAEQRKVDFGSLNEKGLTKMCMELSIPSLAKDWDNEDDAHWDSL